MIDQSEDHGSVQGILWRLIREMEAMDLMALLADQGHGWEVRRSELQRCDGEIASGTDGPMPSVRVVPEASYPSVSQLRIALDGVETAPPPKSTKKRPRADVSRRGRTKSPRRLAAAGKALLKYFSASVGQGGNRVISMLELTRIAKDCGLRGECGPRALQILREHYRVVGNDDTSCVLRGPQDAIRRAAQEFPAANFAELARMTGTSWDTVARALEVV